jgi:hypothetical protein
MRALIALLLMLAITAPAGAQGIAAGERARGEGRCPVGTVGEAAPGGYRCVPAGAAPVQGTPVQTAPAQAAGGQAQEVSRGVIAGWPFALGAAAVLGIGIAAASQGGGSSPVTTTGR